MKLKKLIAIILCVCLLFSMAACKTKTPNKVDSTNDSKNNGKNVLHESNNEKDTEKKDWYKDVHEVYFPLTYMNTHVPVGERTRTTHSDMFILNDEVCVALIGSIRHGESDLKDIHTKLFAKFQEEVSDMDNCVSNINIKTEENTTFECSLKPIDVYSFSGTVDVGNNAVQNYVAGYSFIGEGFLCEMLVFTLDGNVSEKNIENVNSFIEKMMYCVGPNVVEPD